MRLDPAAIAAGVRLVTHETIDSTNGQALRLAREGARGPLWIAARQQTAGRGRRGRLWASPPGNLYASLLLSDAGPADRIAELCFVAALAVHDAICEVVNGIDGRLALKWPNDVLLDGGKLAGILIEAEQGSTVIGIGVNCVSHPQEAAYPAIDLAAAGWTIAPDTVLSSLSTSMLSRLGEWDRGHGFAGIRADWLTRASGLGGRIAVSLPEGERSGCFETLDERGHLILRLDDGTRETVTAGDVLAAAA